MEEVTGSELGRYASTVIWWLQNAPDYKLIYISYLYICMYKILLINKINYQLEGTYTYS